MKIIQKNMGDKKQYTEIPAPLLSTSQPKALKDDTIPISSREVLQINLENKIFSGDFDMELFKEYMNTIHGIKIESYSPVMQNDMFAEMKKQIGKLNKYNLPEFAATLKTIRTGMSVLTEAKYDLKYYKRMIISRNLYITAKVIDTVAESITSPAIQLGQYKYKYSDYKSFRQGFEKIDSKTGLDFFKVLIPDNTQPAFDRPFWGENSFKEKFVELLQQKINTEISQNPSREKELSNMSGHLEVARRMNGTFGFDIPEIYLAGKTIDIKKSYSDYLGHYLVFSDQSREYTNLIAQYQDTKKGDQNNTGLGIGGRRGFGYSELGDKYAPESDDYSKLELSDYVIFFMSIAPYLSLSPFDKLPLLKQLSNKLIALGGIQDLAQAWGRINFDGTIHDTKENIANYTTGTLGILGIADTTGIVAKGIRLAKTHKIRRMMRKILIMSKGLKKLIDTANRGALAIEVPKDQKTWEMVKPIMTSLLSALESFYGKKF